MSLKCVVLSVLLIPIAFPVKASAQQPLFPWRFEEVCTLDTGVPEALVGDMSASTIDGSGRASLLCRHSYIIFRFDSDGSWLGNIDRKGSGPGEFQNPLRITASDEGDLLIFDTENMRITHLSPEGEYIASFNLSNLEIARAVNVDIAFAGSERYWIGCNPIDLTFEGRSERTIALVDRAGRVVWSRGYKEPDLYIQISSPSRPVTGWLFPNPAARAARWSADSGGSAWIISPDCQILTMVSKDGEITREVPLQLPELIISRQDWKAHLDDIRPRDPSMNVTGREMSQFHYEAIEGLRDKVPPLQGVLWVGPEGILINRYGRFRGSERSRRQFTAILPDGRMTEDSSELGVKLGGFCNGYAMCNLSESGELPHVVVYKIVPR